MGKRQPKLPASEVRKELEARLARQDRGPFTEILADAVQAKPTLKAWKRLAQDEPDKYVRSIASMAKAAGFVDRTESLNITGSVTDLAQTLVLRYGPEKARTMLELHGLPTSLIPDTGAIDSAVDG